MQIDIATLRDYEERGLIRSQTHPNGELVIWCYTQEVQYDPIKWDSITKQCRGLITDLEGNVVARPFQKFFNFDDGYLADIGEKFELDFDDATIQVKVDGSLGILYKDNEGYKIATKGSFQSEQAIKATEFLKEAMYLYPDINFDDDYTYLFEVIYPQNRIVVDYGDLTDLVYLCSIHKETGETKFHTDHPFSVTKVYSKDEFTQTWLEQPKGTVIEGFVVLFNNGKRLKFKLDDYRRLHYLLTGLTDRGIWELLMKGRDLATELKDVPDEMYSSIKEYASTLLGKYHNIKGMCEFIMQDAISEHSGRKEQAAFIFQHLKDKKLEAKYSDIVFRMMDNKEYSEGIWKFIYPDPGRSFLGYQEGL